MTIGQVGFVRFHNVYALKIVQKSQFPPKHANDSETDNLNSVTFKFFYKINFFNARILKNIKSHNFRLTCKIAQSTKYTHKILCSYVVDSSR